MSIQDDTTAPPSVKYPTNRRHIKFFGVKFIRLLVKACVANELGQDAFTLLTTIAATEDSKGYRGGVTFHVGQLLPILGFGRWERLDKARRIAVDAGWLCYRAPPSGTRNVAGVYWVLVPDGMSDISDASVDDKADPIAAAYMEGYRDAQAGNPPKAYRGTGDAKGDAQGYAQGYGEGDAQGYAQGYPSSYSLKPKPKPKRESAPEKSKVGKPPKAGTNVPPSLEEVTAFVDEHSLKFDPADFHDYYSSNGWKVGGRGQMKDWHSAARRWARQQTKFNGTIAASTKTGPGVMFDESKANLPTGFEKH